MGLRENSFANLQINPLTDRTDGPSIRGASREWPETLTERKKMTIVARFIHTTLESNQLPTRWELRGGVYQGAQVLSLSEAFEILSRRGHSTDDWYRPSAHTRIAFMKVSDTSGDKGHLNYAAVLPDDIEEMRVIEIDSGLDWSIMEIAMEMGIDTDEAMASQEWIMEEPEEVAEMLWGEMEVVTPEFIDTLA